MKLEDLKPGTRVVYCGERGAIDSVAQGFAAIAFDDGTTDLASPEDLSPEVATVGDALAILAHTEAPSLREALAHIAVSAMDDSDSGADTAAVVYEQLARLGIVAP